MRLHVKLLARKKKHGEAREYVQGAVTALEDVIGTDATVKYILNELEEDQYKYLPQYLVNYVLRELRNALNNIDSTADDESADTHSDLRETD